jgi:hypothetical protein
MAGAGLRIGEVVESAINLLKSENPLIWQLYTIRCEAEDVRIH